jgi:HAE1 family hydrophobic/amphiphilic exporter-1
VIAVGAGAQSRRSIGISVFGGMLGSTIMDQLVVPTFFFLLYSLQRGRGSRARTEGAAPGHAGGQHSA